MAHESCTDKIPPKVVTGKSLDRPEKQNHDKMSPRHVCKMSEIVQSPCEDKFWIFFKHLFPVWSVLRSGNSACPLQPKGQQGQASVRKQILKSQRIPGYVACREEIHTDVR